MKILMVSPSIDYSENLAQTIHQLQFAKELAAKGFEVHMICRKKKTALPFIDTSKSNIVFHKIFSEDLPYKRIIFTMQTRFVVDSILRKGKFDLVHDRGYLFGGAGIDVAQKYSLPTVLQIDDDWIRTEELTSKIGKTKFYQRMAKRWCTKVLNDADKAFAVSETLKRIAVKDWNADGKKISIIPNGVDIKIFNRDVEPYGIKERFGEKSPIITFVGALGPWHGIQNLISAIPLVLKENPEAKFLIVGKAKEYSTEQLTGMVEELRLGDAVHFFGSVAHEDIPRILVESDIGVAPYSNLDFGFSPLKIFEYMACALPVVCSDLPSTREIVENGKDGVLVKSWIKEDLANALVDLISNEQKRKRIGEEGRKKAIDNYTWEKCTEKLIRLYNTA